MFFFPSPTNQCWTDIETVWWQVIRILLHNNIDLGGGDVKCCLCTNFCPRLSLKPWKYRYIWRNVFQFCIMNLFVFSSVKYKIRMQRMPHPFKCHALELALPKTWRATSILYHIGTRYNALHTRYAWNEAI